MSKERTLSENHKKKISETKKKKFADNPKLHPMYGKNHSKESIAKMRFAKLGKKLSKETCKKIGLKNLGKTQTDYQKKIVSEKLSKIWEIEFPDGHIEIIKNLRTFCRQHNLHPSNLISHGHTKGFKAKKLEG